MIKDYKIGFGVHNQISDRNIDYQEHLRHITYFSIGLQLYFNKDVFLETPIESTDINSIITESGKLGCDWLFLIEYGQRFKDPNIIRDLIKYAEDNHYSFLGHLLQTKTPTGDLLEFEIHPQCFLLNVNVWKKIGKPKFGKPGSYSIELNKPSRSKTNFHDDYTPYWLSPTGTKEHYTGYLGHGYNLINTLLEFNHNLGTFSEEIKNRKSFIYPEQDSGEFESILNGKLKNYETKILNQNQRQYLSETSLYNYINSTYIFNTDKVGNEIVRTEFETIAPTSIYSVASGFKLLELLAQTQFDNNTSIVYFDYSKTALDLKEWLYRNWDGKDYLEALKKYKEEKNTDIKYLWRTEHNLKDSDEYIKCKNEWEEVLTYFKGELEWLAFWDKVKKLEHKFIQTDILGDYSKLIDNFKVHRGKNIVWISNVFYSEPIIRNFKPETLKVKYEKLIQDISDNSSSYQILGASILNFPKVINI